MSDHLFGALDLGLVLALIFGLGLWQLITVRRSMRADRKEAVSERPAED